MDNRTIDLIVSRLPKTPLLAASDVAAALGMATPAAVAAAIAAGELAAVRVGNRYRIARGEAERWIRGMEAAK